MTRLRFPKIGEILNNGFSNYVITSITDLEILKDNEGNPQDYHFKLGYRREGLENRTERFSPFSKNEYLRMVVTPEVVTEPIIHRGETYD